MNQGEPGTQAVDELVQDVGVRDAVDGCVDGQSEEEHVCDEAQAARQAGDHVACAHRLDDEDVGHDGEDVVVRGKGGEPVDGEVVDPDDEDREVDGEDPKHED